MAPATRSTRAPPQAATASRGQQAKDTRAKRSRRKAAQDPAPEPQPSTRPAPPSSSTPNTNGNGTRRRLRSAKVDASPLRALPEPTRNPKRKRAAEKAEVGTSRQEQQNNAVAPSEDADEGINRMRKQKAPIYNSEAKLQAENEALALEVKKRDAAIERLSEHSCERDELAVALQEKESEAERLSQRVRGLESKLQASEVDRICLAGLHKDLLSRVLRGRAPGAFSFVFSDSPETSQNGANLWLAGFPESTRATLQGNASALALYEHVLRETAESHNTPDERDDGSHEDDGSESEATPAPTSEEPVLESSAASAVQPPATPPQPTPQPQPGQIRLWNYFTGFFTTRAPEAPAPGEITEALTPTPSSTRENSKKRARKAKKSAEKSEDSTMNEQLTHLLLHSFESQYHRDPEAQVWVKGTVQTLDNNLVSELQKKLDQSLLIDDLTTIPSHLPWKSGFGELFDDYDTPAPAWAIVQDLLEQPRAKKHKGTHDASVTETPSINDLSSSMNSIANSHGNSASRHDFQPRRSTVPSPMFESPITHHEGGNVFNELQTSTEDRVAFERELHAKEHNPSRGSFQVPEDSSDDEQEDAELWTQPPPRAPVPAHASLPVPLDATPSVPAMQGEVSLGNGEASNNNDNQAAGVIERQRAKLMKHTPAKPSRLREATYPSPNVRSEAENESMLTTAPFTTDGSFGKFKPRFGPVPEPRELFDEDEQRELNEWRASKEGQEYHERCMAEWEKACPGDIEMTYDSLSDVTSDLPSDDDEL